MKVLYSFDVEGHVIEAMMDFADNATEDEIEEEYKTWRDNLIDGGRIIIQKEDEKREEERVQKSEKSNTWSYIKK